MITLFQHQKEAQLRMIKNSNYALFMEQGVG